VVGEWVSAEGQALGVRFSDGSSVTLAPHSRARVAGTTTDGADLVLEQASSLPRSSTERGAPGRCGRALLGAVTGTRFTLSWDPTAERLELALQEGAVTVSGPHLPEGRAVVAGEHLRSRCGPARCSSGARMMRGPCRRRRRRRTRTRR
jgi:ferric-dicitrate binding protein FerR (iron transport regulator)